MTGTLGRAIVLAAALAFGPGGTARVGAQEGSKPGGAEGGGGDATEGPGKLDPLFRAIDPAGLQRLLDRGLGLDPGEGPRARPRAPKIGEPVFFDVSRPLGDLKYGNELNYLLNPSTRNAPTLQVIEYEYTFADWNAAELDLAYFNGSLEILTPFYQRTLGVGRRRNWVSGLQISPDIFTRSRFVGGSAVYVLGWKPEEESKFSSLLFLGANRALIGGFNFGPNGPSALRSTSNPTPAANAGAANGDERTYGAWRPTLNIDLFYRLTEKATLGIENDLFFGSGRSGEYFSFPFLTYETGDHAFFQAGGGYDHFESRDQFTFLLHLNFVNPSPRKLREEEKARRRDEPEPQAEPDRDEPGRLRRWLGRVLGDR